MAPLADSRLVALAISGGPDSLALLHLAAGWLDRVRPDTALLVMTVDHGLRSGSADEARFVCDTAKRYRLPSISLRWEGPPPTTAVEERARDARYTLLAEAATTAGATCLVTAHHRDDQAETVLMRLARGSGLRGLAAMRESTVLRPGLLLFRPFLGVPKTRLVATTLSAGLVPRLDASNVDPRFFRARLRAMMPMLAAEGMDSARLAASAAKLRRAAEAVEIYCDRLLAGALKRENGALVLDRERYCDEPAAVRHRALARILAEAGTCQAVRDERLAALDDGICRDAVLRRTLGGAIVSASAGLVRFEAEPPRKAARPKHSADRSPAR